MSLLRFKTVMVLLTSGVILIKKKKKRKKSVFGCNTRRFSTGKRPCICPGLLRPFNLRITSFIS
ncbi:hypothetical protein C5167_040240 [Papaver somniferum]|uniref:Uncharacterized protein n=1 Tax=Papaver somniferum TaxID=3469 RepID=A0A4Y7IEI5_PAPSO|nr:hypothetical protein C5167_040240 [Papaver somniferum]